MIKFCITSILIAIAVITKIEAQNHTKLLIAAELAKPTHQLSESFDSGAGVSLKLRYYFNEKFFAQINPGYLTLRGENRNSTFDNKMQNSFIKMGGGYHLSRILYSELSIGPVFQNGGLGTAFVVSPNIGTQFNISKKFYGDVVLKYENWFGRSITNFFGIGIGLGI